jgi:hypothetical protein
MAIVAMTLSAVQTATALPPAKTMTSEQIREEHAYVTGVQAILWGRPLSESLQTHGAALKVGGSYISYLRQFETLKTAADRFINTPNNVSIDSYGTADLTTEPVVLSVPSQTDKRWTIAQIGDFFDEIVHNVNGSKGSQPGLYALTGPNYVGSIPKGMTQVKLRTRYASIGVRVFVDGEADLPAAREVQKGFHLLPLKVFQANGLAYVIPKKQDLSAFDFKPEAPEPLREFEKIGFAMKQFLSTSDDVSDPMVVSFRSIGLSVAEGFDVASLDEPTKRGLARAASTANQIIDDTFANSAAIKNGWRFSMGGGRAGHDLALLAAFATYSYGANVPEEIMYPNCRVDADKKPFDGVNKYTLRFEKGEAPPVSVFWNMSMYDDKQFFIENDFKRYSIGSTTDGLKSEADGSITIYIQNENPGPEKQSNWLPAPKGSFNLTMRLYGSQAPILNGSYALPAVRRVP